MITFSIPPDAGRRREVSGFTLTEVLIGVALGTLLMAGILSSFLFLARSGAALGGYNELEAHARRSIEDFAQDLRMASAVNWTSNSSITLTIPDNYPTTGGQVTYAFDSGPTGPTARAFYRKAGTAGSTNSPTVLARDVQTFGYEAFDRLDNVLTSPGTTPNAIKRVQLKMLLRKQQVTTVAQTNVVVSASFILRNKPAN
jgi:hypothetical protein